MANIETTKFLLDESLHDSQRAKKMDPKAREALAEIVDSLPHGLFQGTDEAHLSLKEHLLNDIDIRSRYALGADNQTGPASRLLVEELKKEGLGKSHQVLDQLVALTGKNPDLVAKWLVDLTNSDNFNDLTKAVNHGINVSVDRQNGNLIEPMAPMATPPAGHKPPSGRGH